MNSDGTTFIRWTRADREGEAPAEPKAFLGVGRGGSAGASPSRSLRSIDRFHDRRPFLRLLIDARHTAVHARPASPVYAILAPQLAKEVKQIVSAPPISLPVEDQGDGSLLTGWQEPFRGDFHVIRYWHERTRYHISIVPDFADPHNAAGFRSPTKASSAPMKAGRMSTPGHGTPPPTTAGPSAPKRCCARFRRRWKRPLRPGRHNSDAPVDSYD